MSNADGIFLDALYAGAMDNASLERALDMLVGRFGCAGSALVSIDPYAPSTSVIFFTGAFAEGAKTYPEFSALDPAPAAFARMPVGSASTTARLLSEEDHRSVFVNEFFHPLGLVETLGANLFTEKGRVGLLGLHRGRERDAFTEEEIRALERVLPHITRTLQLRRTFAGVNIRASALEATVDRLESAVLILDLAGVAVFANRAMRDIAARMDGLALDRSGRPLIANGEARRRVEGLIESVRTGGAGGRTTIPRMNAKRHYVVLVASAPSHLSEREWDLRRRGGVVIVVHDPDSQSTNAADVLKVSLELTPGAARLAAALAAGSSLADFAESEGVTIHAARFHLRTALTRTGARTQAELVRMAVGMLRDIGMRQGDHPAP